jgi:hypothetical protein
MMTGLLRPTDLHEISSAADDAKMQEERAEREMKLKQKKELEDAFMSRELHPEVHERVNAAIRRAAEQGHHQIQVLTFPASYCNDGGRRINSLDPNWPESLEGFAKRAYEFFDREMKPLGYKLHAEIISFPGGMPGDVGMFLKW